MPTRSEVLPTQSEVMPTQSEVMPTWYQPMSTRSKVMPTQFEVMTTSESFGSICSTKIELEVVASLGSSRRDPTWGVNFEITDLGEIGENQGFCWISWNLLVRWWRLMTGMPIWSCSTKFFLANERTEFRGRKLEPNFSLFSILSGWFGVVEMNRCGHNQQNFQKWSRWIGVVTNLPLERGRFLRFALVASDSVLSSTGQEMKWVNVWIVTGTFHHQNWWRTMDGFWGFREIS